MSFVEGAAFTPDADKTPAVPQSKLSDMRDQQQRLEAYSGVSVRHRPSEPSEATENLWRKRWRRNDPHEAFRW